MKPREGEGVLILDCLRNGELMMRRKRNEESSGAIRSPLYCPRFLNLASRMDCLMVPSHVRKCEFPVVKTAMTTKPLHWLT